MSGHSKWATTKRAKAVTDAKKSAAFTKVANLITIAARKGGDPAANFALRIAVDKARAVNMPKDNIEKAIRRGMGEGGGTSLEELIYEGIGPAKAQFVIKCVTDNKNRSAAEIRHLFSEAGGSLGSVMWNFEQKGVIGITNEELRITNLDDFELELADNGAEDVKREEEGVTVFTEVEDFEKVKRFLEAKKIGVEAAEIEYVAKEDIELQDDELVRAENFIDWLEKNEDVSDYYHNIKNV